MDSSIIESYRMPLQFLFKILFIIRGERIGKTSLGKVKEAHLNHQADDIPDSFRAYHGFASWKESILLGESQAGIALGNQFSRTICVQDLPICRPIRDC